jgi:hypothetical protein
LALPHNAISDVAEALHDAPIDTGLPSMALCQYQWLKQPRVIDTGLAGSLPCTPKGQEDTQPTRTQHRLVPIWQLASLFTSSRRSSRQTRRLRARPQTDHKYLGTHHDDAKLAPHSLDVISALQKFSVRTPICGAMDHVIHISPDSASNDKGPTIVAVKNGRVVDLPVGRAARKICKHYFTYYFLTLPHFF